MLALYMPRPLKRSMKTNRLQHVYKEGGAGQVNHGVQHYSQGSLSAAQMCWEQVCWHTVVLQHIKWSLLQYSARAQAVAAPGAEAHMQGVLQNLRQVL